MDVVDLVRKGNCQYEFAEIVSNYDGYSLFINVFRDAMKFDEIPALTWNFKPIVGDKRIFNGVRLPASAHQLQEIADLLNCMLMTTKVIDMLWLKAGIRFDAVINVNGVITANSHIHNVHQKIEENIEKLGGDDGKNIISCVGKYWCITNRLIGLPRLHNDEVACNYGWFARRASGPGLTPGTQCWQRPGFRHNKRHWDPSQTIRLMHRKARLIYPNGTEKIVDLYDIAANKKLAPLISHEGKLNYLWQKGVDRLNTIISEPFYPESIEEKPIENPIENPIEDKQIEKDPVPDELSIDEKLDKQVHELSKQNILQIIKFILSFFKNK